MRSQTTPDPVRLPFHTAVEQFLIRARFAPRTRQSYAQDLAPLLADYGIQPVSAVLTSTVLTPFMGAQEDHAATTYNRRLATLRSLVRWCRTQGWLTEDPLRMIERRSIPRRPPRALDPAHVEAVLSRIQDRRDRALFWLIYDGGLRCREALALNIDEIEWAERSVPICGKGEHRRESFFSRRVARYLVAYLKERGEPTHGPLFVTARRAREPRTADLSVEGYARLSYRQADTRWKIYAPDWDVHQLRHTAISARAAKGYTEVELKWFSGHRSVRSLEVYIAYNHEAAKRKAREWERRTSPHEASL